MTDIPYKIIRSARKTVALQITPAGEVIVRCPNRYPAREIRRFVSSKEDWLRKHLAKLENRPEPLPFTREELEVLADRAAAVISQRVRQLAPLVGVSYEIGRAS